MKDGVMMSEKGDKDDCQGEDNEKKLTRVVNKSQRRRSTVTNDSIKSIKY
jgi:hypothetical protein